MNYLLSQIFLCLLVAFILGLIIGWLLKRLACKKCEQELQQLHQQITDLKNRKPEVQSTTETPLKMEKVIEKLEESIDPADEFKPVFLSAARNGQGDDLKRIKGVGKVLEGTLNQLGIYHFDQISAWSSENAQWMDTFMQFPGRIGREGWVNQAKLLASGGETEFSKKVGKNKIYD